MIHRENSAGLSPCQGGAGSPQSPQVLLEASGPPGHLLQESGLASFPHLLKPQASSVLCLLGLHLLARVRGHH